MADRDAGPGPGEKAAANAADLLSGLLFVLVGLAVLYGSWTMPRLANRGIHPLTAPGLVPGLLALALLVCGGLLAAGAWRGGGIAGGVAALAAIGDSDSIESLTAVLVTDQEANVELTGGAARALVAMGAADVVAQQVTAWLAAGRAGRDGAARTATWAALVTGAAVAVPGAAADCKRLAGERDLAMRGAACRAIGALPADAAPTRRAS